MVRKHPQRTKKASGGGERVAWESQETVGRIFVIIRLKIIGALRLAGIKLLQHVRTRNKGAGKKEKANKGSFEQLLFVVCGSFEYVVYSYENDDDDSCEEQLEDDEDGISGSEVFDISIHARQHVCDGLTNGDHDSEKLLGTLEQLTIFLVALVNLHTGKKKRQFEKKQTVQQMRKNNRTIRSAVLRFLDSYLDDLASCEQLHDESGGDNGRDTEFHEGTTVRCEDDADPVEGVRAIGSLDAVQRNLAAHQEDEQRHHRPHHFLLERNLNT
jgi:hypothetical protein